MCGLVGIARLEGTGKPPERPELLRMLASLRHRGPNESGLYRDAHAGLGHARLSIIDLATGQQPLPNEEKDLWVAFNGEIFNYVELRAELEALGHRFRTKSDTEVIVHAYEAWGNAAFARFNGQWALALWDAKKKKLVLCRDYYGQQPLYWARNAGRIYFASELRALFAGDRALAKGFDPHGIDQTFTFWSTVPPRTVFLGIEELEPGTVMTFEAGMAKKERYWQPRYPLGEDGLFKGSLEEATEAVRAALEKACRLRMLRSDVPVGSYLSGGIDSSLIAALAKRAVDRFHTFSVGFDDAEYDERKYQQIMCQAIGSEHHEVLVTPAQIAAVFPEVVRHAERPLLRTAAAPLFLLSRKVQELGIKVVLTGEGADEMFAGYDLFREGKVRRYWAKQPGSEVRPRLLERLYPYMARNPAAQKAFSRQFFGRGLERASSPGFAHDTRWSTTRALRRLFSVSLLEKTAHYDPIQELFASLPAELPRWSSLAQDQYLECRTLLSGYLLSSQGDRMLMAHSIEGRLPFLDIEVMELAATLPAHYKLRALDEKHVLKRASRGLVPQEILARSKQPYRAPDALSFTGPEARLWVEEVLSEKAVRNAAVFEPAAVAMLWKKCREPKGPFSNSDNMAMVGVLSTQLLHGMLHEATPAADEPSDLKTDVLMKE